MAVSTSIYQELLFLGSSVLVGMGLFFLYDILRIFRRILPHGNIWIGVEDFLYWIIFTAWSLSFYYRENDGMVLRVCVWRSAGRNDVLLSVAQPPDRALSGVDLEKNTGNTWKSAGIFRASGVENLEKSWGICGKRLKKFVRAVKIGLCKL